MPDQCIAIKKDTQDRGGYWPGAEQCIYNSALLFDGACWGVLREDGGIWTALLKLDSAEHLTPVHSCADNKFVRNVTYLS